MGHTILLTAHSQQSAMPIEYPSYRSALVALRTLRRECGTDNVTMTITTTTPN